MKVVALTQINVNKDKIRNFIHWKTKHFSE